MLAFRPAVASIAALVLSALTLAGCQGPGLLPGPTAEQQPQPAPMPEYPATIRPEELVGRWGYAAYHREEDRPRIENMARAQCGKPVVITRGPTGGVMMYLADQNELQELRVKGGPGGKNFIGPAGPSGGPQDREIDSFDGRVMIAHFVDPEVAGRYGTAVYVRCGATA